MRKLDLYILKKFLSTFFLAIILIVVIVIIFDLSEKIDDFLGSEAPLTEIIGDYYFNFLPYFVNLFSPLFTFIAVVYFTSRLAANTEFVAMLAGGISFNRLLVPYFIGAFFIAIMTFTLSNFLIPPANVKREAFNEKYISLSKQSKKRNIHVQAEKGTLLYVEYFNTYANEGMNFGIEKFDEKGMLYYKLNAKEIIWDTLNNWTIKDFYIRHIRGENEIIERRAVLDTVIKNFHPNDLIANSVKKENLNLFELNRYINSQILKGADDVEEFKVEKYKRLVDPFSIFIFTLIGVSLSSRKVRGGIGFHLGMGLAICFAYVLFMQISTTFATYGNLPPVMGVFIPNILFGLLAIYLVKIAPK